MYQASIPAFLRALGVLHTLLEKAQAHAEEHGIVPETLLGARLADDMHPLTAQVQRASDASKLAVERLSGIASPNFYFHIVTAYDILRKQGVAVGKRDYLGPF